jgi:hypothetical protein
MARKTLLTEAEIRQFMKLANIKPLQEMGGELPVGNRDDDDLDEMRKMKTKGDDEDPPGMKDMREADRDDKDEDPPGMKDMREADHDDDQDKPGMKDMREEEEDDDPPGMKDMREEEMDMDMGGDGMEMDMKMDAPAPDMDMGGKEEQFADIVDKLADLLGLDADVEVGGDEDMGGEAMGDEGGDLEGAMDAPVGDEDPMMEADEDEMNEEEIVQEVARRVAARLLREKKQDDMANRLAESIFNKLTSK